MDFDESELDENGFDENGFWWKWILMKVVFDGSGFWWKWFFDEKWQFHPILTPNRTCTHGTEDLEDYQRLASLAARSHFPASYIRSFSICPKLLLEWDEIQKLLAHTTLHIWCACSLRRPAGRPCFLVHVSSTLAQSCVGHHLAQSGSFARTTLHVWTWELSLLVIPTLQTFFTILLHLTSPRHVFVLSIFTSLHEDLFALWILSSEQYLVFPWQFMEKPLFWMWFETVATWRMS